MYGGDRLVDYRPLFLNSRHSSAIANVSQGCQKLFRTGQGVAYRLDFEPYCPYDAGMGADWMSPQT